MEPRDAPGEGPARPHRRAQEPGCADAQRDANGALRPSDSDRGPARQSNRAVPACLAVRAGDPAPLEDIGKVTVLQRKVAIEGTCSDRFAPVREAFAHNLETGQDI